MAFYQRKGKDGTVIPGKWEVKVYFGTRQVVRRARTEREAKALERELLNARDVARKRAEALANGAPLDMTLEELAVMWWERHIVARKRSPNTQDYYADQLRMRLVGTPDKRRERPDFLWLGDYPMSSLTRLMLDDWIAAMVNEQRVLADGTMVPLHAPRSINASIRTLKAIWNKGLDWEVIEAPNRAARLEEVPEVAASARARKALTVDEVMRIADACSSDRDRTMVVVLGFTGMRLAEAAGLTWDCIDFDERTLEVRRQWDEHGPRPTKTHTTGAVPMTATLTRALVWLHAQRRSDIVFALRRNPDRPVYTNSWRQSNFRPAAVRAGLPDVTPHKLRHTFRSLLRVAGADQTLAKELLRHSTDEMSLYYAHTYAGEARAVIDRIDDLVGLNDQPPNHS